MKKKITAILVATALFASLALTGCSGDNGGNSETSATTPKSEETSSLTETAPAEEDPVKDIAETVKEGHFAYGYSAGDYGEMVRFLNFYDSTVYYGQSGGGGTQGYVYNYSVEETPFEYSVWYTREEREAGKANDEKPEDTGLHTGTASHTITIASLEDSSVSYKLGYDGEYIYTGDAETSAFIIDDAQRMRFDHDTDENSGYKTAYDGETGQTIVRLQKSGDETCFVEIYHNGEYGDFMEMAVNGTWSVSAEGEKTVYALTPDNASDTPAVLTVNGDGTGVYTPENGEAADMVSEKEEAEILSTLTGSASGMDMTGSPTDIPYTLNLYGDFTWELIMENMGTELAAATGSFEADYSTGNFILSVGESDYFTEDITVTAKYNADFTQVESMSCTIPAIEAAYISEAELTSGAAETETEAAALYTFTDDGTIFSGVVTAELVLFDNGTCEYKLFQSGEQAGETLAGTYSTEDFNGADFPSELNFEGADPIVIEKDWANMRLSADMQAVSNDVPVAVYFALPTA